MQLTLTSLQSQTSVKSNHAKSGTICTSKELCTVPDMGKCLLVGGYYHMELWGSGFKPWFWHLFARHLEAWT